MTKNSVHGFRILFVVGLILLFLSLFVQWYSYQVYNMNGKLIASWIYNIFSGWNTPLLNSSVFNESLRPVNNGSPLTITILLIVALLISGYIILFKDVEHAIDMEAYYKFGYILIFLLGLVFVYVFIFPFLYLLSNNMLFPFFKIMDYENELINVYNIQPGYLLQVFVFPLLFPYCIFYFNTIRKFRQQENTSEKKVQNIIAKSQEVLDLDKLIAQEELRQKIK